MNRFSRLTPIAALLILAAPLVALSQDKKDVTPGDVRYNAAPPSSAPTSSSRAAPAQTTTGVITKPERVA